MFLFIYFAILWFVQALSLFYSVYFGEKASIFAKAGLDYNRILFFPHIGGIIGVHHPHSFFC
jgi:hypothetical protein